MKTMRFCSMFLSKKQNLNEGKTRCKHIGHIALALLVDRSTMLHRWDPKRPSAWEDAPVAAPGASDASPVRHARGRSLNCGSLELLTCSAWLHCKGGVATASWHPGRQRGHQSVSVLYLDVLSKEKIKRKGLKQEKQKQDQDRKDLEWKRKT